jgi:4-hydroxyphenylpyruvate dioxygenase
MNIDHIQFYVEDAPCVRDWFIQHMGFRSLGSASNDHTQFEVISSGTIVFVLASPLQQSSPVHQFLQHHPPGVVDVAFRVSDLDRVMRQATHALQHYQSSGQSPNCVHPIQQVQQQNGHVRWAKIGAWGTLRHTLIERTELAIGLASILFEDDLVFAEKPSRSQSNRSPIDLDRVCFNEIDHIVLNVAIGDLNAAVTWYQQVLGFEPQQTFEIQTNYSGLYSRVMQHPETGVRLPINEPSSINSQIQEFLDLNHGAGVQHIALHTENLVDRIATLRQTDLSFLHVPQHYYDQLVQREGFLLSDQELAAIADQQILVDWQADNPEAILLQTFTQPIFQQPTFFFELIERKQYRVNQHVQHAQGFGEGNFQALFEAIEREQLKRGSLKR